MTGILSQLPIRAKADAAIVSYMGTSVRLPPESPGRGYDCLICARPIGGSLAEQITIWPVMQKGCHCGNLRLMAFLVHASCPRPGVTRIMAMVAARLEIDHAAGDECW